MLSPETAESAISQTSNTAIVFCLIYSLIFSLIRVSFCQFLDNFAQLTVAVSVSRAPLLKDHLHLHCMYNFTDFHLKYSWHRAV